MLYNGEIRGFIMGPPRPLTSFEIPKEHGRGFHKRIVPLKLTPHIQESSSPSPSSPPLELLFLKTHRFSNGSISNADISLNSSAPWVLTWTRSLVVKRRPLLSKVARPTMMKPSVEKQMLVAMPQP